MRNWTSRQSEVMYETDRVVFLFFTSKDEGKRYAHHTEVIYQEQSRWMRRNEE